MPDSFLEEDYQGKDLSQIPRRLRRFYRKDYPNQSLFDLFFSFLRQRKEDKIVKDVVSQIGDSSIENDARRAVREFHKQHNRFPNKSEYSILIDDIYSQTKKEMDKEEEIKKTFDFLAKKLSAKNKAKEKSDNLRARRRRRGRNKQSEQSNNLSPDPFSFQEDISLSDLSFGKPSDKKEKSSSLPSEDSGLSFDSSEFDLPEDLLPKKKKKDKNL